MDNGTSSSPRCEIYERSTSTCVPFVGLGIYSGTTIDLGGTLVGTCSAEVFTGIDLGPMLLPQIQDTEFYADLDGDEQSALDGAVNNAAPNSDIEVNFCAATNSLSMEFPASTEEKILKVVGAADLALRIGTGASDCFKWSECMVTGLPVTGVGGDELCE